MSSILTVTNLKHASSGSNNVVLDGSGNTTVSGNLTSTGNLTVQNGDIIMASTKKVKQKGAFMQSSTHQALTLGY